MFVLVGKSEVSHTTKYGSAVQHYMGCDYSGGVRTGTKFNFYFSSILLLNISLPVYHMFMELVA